MSPVLKIGGKMKIKTQRYSTSQGGIKRILMFKLITIGLFRRKIIFADRGPNIKLPRRFSDSSLRSVPAHIVWFA